MNVPFKLFRLQQIDSQCDRANSRLEEIRALLEPNEHLRNAIEVESLTKETLLTAQKALKKAEETVQAQRIKIETDEAALYSGRIRLPKELKDLENEIASLKKFLAVLEDRQLDAMLTVDEATQVYSTASDELKKQKDIFDRSRKTLLDEQTHLYSEIDTLKTERTASASDIAPGDLALYEQLRKQRRGVAVAKVTNKACAACGTTLSASLLQAAFSPSQISRCETCGRILYGV
jgi:uncharacterized protein